MTSVNSDYTTLSSYLQGQQFGPKTLFSDTNMSYPILPQYHVNYGYNALTHDGDNGKYYTINNGYTCGAGQSTTFMVGSCPTNSFVKDVPPPPQNFAEYEITNTYEGFNSRPGMYQNIRDRVNKLNIIMFTKDGCFHCRQAMKNLDLQRWNIKTLNVANPANLRLFREWKGKGVPYFVSLTTRKTHTGNPQTISNLLSKLDGPTHRENFETSPVDALRNLDVNVLLSKTCGHCKTFRNLLEKENASNAVKIYYNNDPEANAVFSKYSFNGVPFMFSAKTGKYITGAPNSISQLVQSLS